MGLNESKGNRARWRENNREKIRAWKLKWAKSENGKASQRRYRSKSSKAMRFLYIASAKKRGLLFDISEKAFTELISKECVYCGASSTNKRNGLDRVDNSMGYTLENVVPCCFMCNQMKGKLSTEEFFDHIIRIIDYGTK